MGRGVGEGSGLGLGVSGFEPPPPGRSGSPVSGAGVEGPSEEGPLPPPEDEAVSSSTPEEADVGGADASGAATAVGEGVAAGSESGSGSSADATISPTSAVPASGPGRLSSGRSPGRIAGASASSAMTTQSARVQSACVPSRLPTVSLSAHFPSDLNGRTAATPSEPPNQPGFGREQPRSRAPERQTRHLGDRFQRLLLKRTKTSSEASESPRSGSAHSSSSSAE